MLVDAVQSRGTESAAHDCQVISKGPDLAARSQGSTINECQIAGAQVRPNDVARLKLQNAAAFRFGSNVTDG
jgi:hypothetical protein